MSSWLKYSSILAELVSFGLVDFQFVFKIRFVCYPSYLFIPINMRFSS